MKTFPRYCEGVLRAPTSSSKVRMLFGARQTGKSTLLRRLASPETVVFNLQQRSLRLEMERNPAVLTQTLEADSRGRIIVHIDEIQRVPALLDEVQYLYDKDPGRYAFLLTGSSARKLKTASANLLPGRAHRWHLCPLILSEYADYEGSLVLPPPAHASLPGGFPKPALEDLLLYGNLPGIVREQADTRILTLESYVELYLEEEIRREALVRNIGAFQQFLELAALESGHVMHLSNLARESGVPLATLRTFYQVLEDTFIGYRIPAFGVTGRKRVLTTPRFLFFDNGVRNAAARLKLSPELLKTQMGLLFENWVGQELAHRCSYAGRSYRLGFWRTVHGAEVDYVLETPEEVIPIEVKATESPTASDARHLRLFLQTYPERARRGYVICRCRAPRKLTENIDAVPWSRL